MVRAWRPHVVLSIIALIFASSAEAAISRVSSPRAAVVPHRPTLSLALSVKTSSGNESVVATGSLDGTKHKGLPPRAKWRAVLEWRVLDPKSLTERRWQTLREVHLTTSRHRTRYRVLWSGSPISGAATFRVVVLAGKQIIATSRDISHYPELVAPSHPPRSTPQSPQPQGYGPWIWSMGAEGLFTLSPLVATTSDVSQVSQASLQGSYWIVHASGSAILTAEPGQPLPSHETTLTGVKAIAPVGNNGAVILMQDGTVLDLLQWVLFACWCLGADTVLCALDGGERGEDLPVVVARLAVVDQLDRLR
jgi:hypothetical protein